MKKSDKLISPYSYVGIVYDEVINAKNHKQKKLIVSEITKSQILQIISDECNVSVKKILSSSRKRTDVDARNIYFVALRLKFNLSLESIGKIVGNRHHTTVMNGLNNFHSRYSFEMFYRNLANNVFINTKIDYNGIKMTKLKYL